ncbi:MAG: hypothetical protein QF512_16695 [Alphaproteobacteria bacterium]|jgi:hypothetical protein|nr:hypothetical protein [Alphaproteobacteria bacterium]
MTNPQTHILAPSQPPVLVQFTRRGIQDPAEMLASMQECRKTLVKVLTERTITGPADKKAEEVIERLDDLVEELTGNRDCLWKGGVRP